MLKSSSMTDDNKFSKPLSNSMQITEAFQKILDIVSQLRGPNGCPWDKEQTHQSLAKFAIEEAYELAETLDELNYPLMQEELGDYLFQVILHAQIASEENHFSLLEVLTTLNDKMIRRHPHVFSNEKAETSEQVLKNWELIKKAEKNGQKQKILNVPVQIPALQRAFKIGEKTNKLKFDWENANQVWIKVEEEIQELKNVMDSENQISEEKFKKELSHELGDVLFSLAQLARHYDLDPEQTLRQANRRFETRFETMNELIEKDLKNLASLDNASKEAYWQQAKKLVN